MEFVLPVLGAIANAAVVQIDEGRWYIVDQPERVISRQATFEDYRPFRYIEPLGGLRVRAGDDGSTIKRVLFFPTGKADLTPRQVELIRSACCNGAEFVVEGHADPKGSAQVNDQIARARATAVADVLRQAGAQNVKIEVVGERKPVCRDTSLACEARNRRVVLRIAGGAS